jgi:hypothetical protein
MCHKKNVTLRSSTLMHGGGTTVIHVARQHYAKMAKVFFYSFHVLLVSDVKILPVWPTYVLGRDLH